MKQLSLFLIVIGILLSSCMPNKGECYIVQYKGEGLFIKGKHYVVELETTGNNSFPDVECLVKNVNGSTKKAVNYLSETAILHRDTFIAPGHVAFFNLGDLTPCEDFENKQ